MLCSKAAQGFDYLFGVADGIENVPKLLVKIAAVVLRNGVECLVTGIGILTGIVPAIAFKVGLLA